MIKEADISEIKRIVKLSKGKVKSANAVKNKKLLFVKDNDSVALLQRCYDNWMALSQVREQRKRNIRYKNGDQWSDSVDDPDFKGRTIREDVLIKRKGQLPLKHNIIGQVVRNLTGQMLANPSQSVVYARNEEDQSMSEMFTNALNACHHLNNVRKLDIAILEELILSGIGCVKVRYDYVHEKNRSDGKIEPVNVNRLFFNKDVEDPRLFDLNFIGQMHDYTLDEIITSFASSSGDEMRIREIFSQSHGSDTTLHKVGESNADSINFYTSSSISKYRVYEIWQREGRWVNYVHDPLDATQEITELSRAEIDKINIQRIESARKVGGTGDEVPLIEFFEKYEYYWSVKFIDSQGYLLKTMISPFTHESHPYALAVMPMIDGEFQSYVADLIDMQRYINRLIVMIDFVMGASAKGVLMIPEDCIPDGYSADDFAQEYIKTNGVIVYKPSNKGNLPMQITTNSTPSSAWNMLQTQLGLIEKVSGVSEVMQGRGVSSSTPASLYAQQVSNSQLNFRVVFEAFSSFTRERDEKLLKTLMQFYTDKRVVDISGASASLGARYWDPIEAKKILDFNLVVTQSFDTPVYRMQFEERLLAMLNGRFIDFKMYLKNSSLPFAKSMLAQIDAQQNVESNNLINDEKEAEPRE